jgi:hypothetical protein
MSLYLLYISLISNEVEVSCDLPNLYLILGSVISVSAPSKYVHIQSIIFLLLLMQLGVIEDLEESLEVM